MRRYIPLINKILITSSYEGALRPSKQISCFALALVSCSSEGDISSLCLSHMELISCCHSESILDRWFDYAALVLMRSQTQQLFASLHRARPP